jgi:glyoxylase-like metal-dependent hydrolase (beta-lactamase superfamily II)
MARLQIKQVTVGKWQENCYLLVCPETKEAALIDPGDEFEKIAKMVGKVRVTKILLTHADPDHIGALQQARTVFRAPVLAHPNEVDRPSYPNVPPIKIEGTKPLSEGQTIRIGTGSVKVFEVPGHTPGQVVFLLDDRAIVGDSIFTGGPGRTKKPEDLVTSLYNLQRVVFRWPDRTKLYAGHGKPTTVGAERDNFMRYLAQPREADQCGDVSWANA